MKIGKKLVLLSAGILSLFLYVITGSGGTTGGLSLFTEKANADIVGSEGTVTEGTGGAEGCGGCGAGGGEGCACCGEGCGSTN